MVTPTYNRKTSEIAYKARVIALLVGLLILSGCGGGGDDVAGTGSPPSSTEDYLRPIGFTSNVLQRNQRLVAYSKIAGRVSVVDPVQQREIWGKTAQGFDYGIKLPQLDGAALFNERSIEIFTETDRIRFPVELDYIHTASASNNTAYSVSSLDGLQFQIIRSLGGGEWQQQIFDVPWGVIDPAVTQPPQGQSVLLATYYNANATLLAVFSPSDGRYVVYTAASETDQILDTSSWCAGDGVGTPGDTSYRSIVWHETLQMFFVGDKNGRVYMIDPLGPCALSTSIVSIGLPNNIPVTNLVVYSDGRIAAVQDEAGSNGSLNTLTFDGSSFATDPIVLENICEIPLSSLLLANNRIVVLCTTEAALDEDNDSPRNIYIEPRLYVIADMLTGDIINQVTIDKGLSAGVAIDPESNTLYRIQEGAFGKMDTINLITGESNQSGGMYIEGILD